MLVRPRAGRCMWTELWTLLLQMESSPHQNCIGRHNDHRSSHHPLQIPYPHHIRNQSQHRDDSAPSFCSEWSQQEFSVLMLHLLSLAFRQRCETCSPRSCEILLSRISSSICLRIFVVDWLCCFLAASSIEMSPFMKSARGPQS
jgi:hypothetical protein